MPDLPPCLPGTLDHLDDPVAGRVARYGIDGGAGVPVLLVHSVNAAASAYELRPVAEALAGERPVVALDLPGFGHSQRGPRRYDPPLFEAAIAAVLTAIGSPAHVVALSLGAELAAAAAADHPDAVASLTAISPTGLGRPARRHPDAIEPVLRVPLWSGPLFGALVTRASIRWFLQRSRVRPVEADLVEHAVQSAHQPGARDAPWAFLAGRPFSPDALALYRRVRCPSLVLYDRDAFTDFRRLPELLTAPNWRAERITPTRGLPHWDEPAATMEALRRFWAEVETEVAGA